MNKTNPREKLEAVIFMSTIASRKSEGLTASHSRGSDEYTGDSIIGGAMCEKDARLSVSANGGSILHAFGMPEMSKSKSLLKWVLWIAIAIVVAITLASCSNEEAWADMITEGSWYDVKSCLREGTSGICADGKPLDDKAFSCAHPTEPFGQKLRVTRLDRPELSCIVVVRDRGPAKRLLRLGRSIDLSKAAGEKMDIIGCGHAIFKVERIGG